MRAAFFRFIRTFFCNQGFLEVSTPLRQPVFIPENTIVPLASGNQYLQTSPELCMKRLLAAGSGNIFQICHCFRKDERGQLHLEEFQMLEWYREGRDYYSLMEDCEALLRFLLTEFEKLRLPFPHQSNEKIFPGIDLQATWQRLTVKEAFSMYSPATLEAALAGGSFDEVLVEHIEPNLGHESPLFLIDYPAELASLARKKADDRALAERFELYLNGVEVANGFSELTDEKEQRERFVEEIAMMRASGGREVIMPERFLQDLKKLDSAAGIAMGLDRLFMLAMGYKSISEAVSFAPDDF